MERRADIFIEAPVEEVDVRRASAAELALDAKRADAHFRGLRGGDSQTFAACTHTFTAE
jgi:hypothetical protein